MHTVQRTVPSFVSIPVRSCDSFFSSPAHLGLKLTCLRATVLALSYPPHFLPFSQPKSSTRCLVAGLTARQSQRCTVSGGPARRRSATPCASRARFRKTARTAVAGSSTSTQKVRWLLLSSQNKPAMRARNMGTVLDLPCRLPADQSAAFLSCAPSSLAHRYPGHASFAESTARALCSCLLTYFCVTAAFRFTIALAGTFRPERLEPICERYVATLYCNADLARF